MSTESYLSETSEPAMANRSSQRSAANGGEVFGRWTPAQKVHTISDSTYFLFRKDLSPWSRSGAKRIFDCVCVLSMMPLLIPVLLAVALAVRLTSEGPVLFLQKRVGRNGRSFTIVKFRTMIHAAKGVHQPITTCGNQLFTPVGPFLRRWKLDEMPQLFNVLAGEMSLVGPRPKLPEHAISNLPCRAGITGAATVAFAREESILASVSERHLEGFYNSIVLPAKHQLDAEYMAHATFSSDLRIILDSVFRRWHSAFLECLLDVWLSEQGDRMHLSGKIDPGGNLYKHPPMVPKLDRPAPTGEIRAY